MTTCACGKPTSGGAWCSRCTRTVEIAVANVATYHDELDTVRSRQTSYGGMTSSGSIGKSQPLVLDASFLPDGRGSLAQAAARNAVTTWARVLLEAIPPLTIPTCVDRECKRCAPIRTEAARRAHPLDTVHSVCSYFARNLTTIAALPWAPEFKADMLGVERSLARIVDRPVERWYAGECGFELQHDASNCACACHGLAGAECDVPGGCGRENTACTRVLYAEPDNPFVKCPDCRTTWQTEQRREWLLEEAEDREATVEMIARVVVTLGERNVTTAKVSARIRQWAVRGKITSHGTRVVDGRPRPLYRIGDVLDLLNTEEKVGR